MKITTYIAAVVGLGTMFTPCAASAQNAVGPPATASATAATTPPAIPVDQQPTKEQLAKLFETMRLRAQLQTYMKLIPEMVQKQVHAQFHETAEKLGTEPLKPDQQAALDKMLAKYMEKATNIITVDELLEDVSTIYQHHVSRQDVDAMIAFYASPAGQHLLDAQPAIMQEYMPMIMKRTQERGKALSDALAADLAEFAKSQNPSAESPAAK